MEEKKEKDAGVETEEVDNMEIDDDVEGVSLETLKEMLEKAATTGEWIERNICG